MYKIFIAHRKIEKKLREYLSLRRDIRNKLDSLKLDPRRANGAHPLHGQLKGKWVCWLGSNIRLIYSINDFQKRLNIEAVGTHKLY